MVNYSSGRLDKVFSALADPTRRQMIAMLSRDERSVSELAKPFRMSLPAVSKHLKILEESGLIVRRVEGRVHRISMDPESLEEAIEWIRRHKSFWEKNLENLARYLKPNKRNPQ